MQSVTKIVGKHGEVALPKEFRVRKKLKSDSRIEIIDTKDAIVIIPADVKFRDLVGMFGKGKFGKRGMKDIEEIEATMFELIATG